MTVKDRAGASITNKILCQLQMTLLVKHMYGQGYYNIGNMNVEKYCVQTRMLDIKLWALFITFSTHPLIFVDNDATERYF